MNDRDEEYKKLLEDFTNQLQRARIADYVDLMQNPGRMIIFNLFGGIARGFGIAIGFTVLGAIVIYLLQRIVVLNLPIISGVISEIVKLVKLNVR